MLLDDEATHAASMPPAGAGGCMRGVRGAVALGAAAVIAATR
jgi:hypothetical protein